MRKSQNWMTENSMASMKMIRALGSSRWMMVSRSRYFQAISIPFPPMS